MSESTVSEVEVVVVVVVVVVVAVVVYLPTLLKLHRPKLCERVEKLMSVIIARNKRFY
jgi:hypothetical protein